MGLDLRVGVLTCSDTRAAGDAEDTAGKELMRLCEERGWLVAAYHVCPDDAERIHDLLVEMSDSHHVDVILTCGGTGFGPRDVTPEATERVIEKRTPGVAEAIRLESLKITGRAMLSRGTAGIRDSTLIINLPGSRKAASESFGFVADQLEHAVEMMAGGGHS